MFIYFVCNPFHMPFLRDMGSKTGMIIFSEIIAKFCTEINHLKKLKKIFIVYYNYYLIMNSIQYEVVHMQ